jgi:hypothetical protein
MGTITEACATAARWSKISLDVAIVDALFGGRAKRDAVRAIRKEHGWTEARIETRWKALARPANTKWSGPWIYFEPERRIWISTATGRANADRFARDEAARKAAGEPIVTATMEVKVPAAPKASRAATIISDTICTELQRHGIDLDTLAGGYDFPTWVALVADHEAAAASLPCPTCKGNCVHTVGCPAGDPEPANATAMREALEDIRDFVNSAGHDLTTVVKNFRARAAVGLRGMRDRDEAPAEEIKKALHHAATQADQQIGHEADPDRKALWRADRDHYRRVLGYMPIVKDRQPTG